MTTPHDDEVDTIKPALDELDKATDSVGRITDRIAEMDAVMKPHWVEIAVPVVAILFVGSITVAVWVAALALRDIAAAMPK